MTRLSSLILAVALLALPLAAVAAIPIPALRADLDGDGDEEWVVRHYGPDPWSVGQLFKAYDVDKDGDPDEIATRGVPTLLCNLDQDRMMEAVVQDSKMTKPWTRGSIINPTDRDSTVNSELVFVRGRVLQCVSKWSPDSEQILYVYDPAFKGTVCIDRDGVAELVFSPGPTPD